MAYTVVDKPQTKVKQTLKNLASKDNFPSKTERAKKLLSKAGLPKELKAVKE